MAHIIDSAYKGDCSSFLPLMSTILPVNWPPNRLYDGDWHRFPETVLEIQNWTKFPSCSIWAVAINGTSSNNFRSMNWCYTWINQNQSFQPSKCLLKLTIYYLFFFNRKLAKSWGKKQKSIIQSIIHPVLMVFLTFKAKSTNSSPRPLGK